MTKFNLSALLIGFSILFVFGYGVAQSQSGSKPKGQKIPLKYVDIQIVPVGPVPLARFGYGQGDKKSEDDAGKKNPADDGKKNVPDVGPKGFVVLERDERETPPRSLYLKQGNGYYVIPCHQNSIGAPVRVPLTDAAMVFYKRQQSENGTVSYVEYAKSVWKPGQDRILFTLTKKLNNKYWNEAVLRSYSLSSSVAKNNPLVVVNAGRERQIGILMEGKPQILVPHKRVLLGSNLKKNQLKLKLGVLLEGNKFHAPMNVSLPRRENEQMLLLAYPCTYKESFRGIKIAKGRLTWERARKARFVPIRRN